MSGVVSHVLLAGLLILCVNGFKTPKYHSFASKDDLSMEHLKEHYDNKIDIEKHTSSSDRQFFYFQVGDTNKDHHLDGIELFKMITEHSHEEGKGGAEVESIEVQVDQVLSDIDKNMDGRISYSEYSRKFA